MCFVDMEKTSDRVPRMVIEWSLRKKGVPEIMVRMVTSLYEGAKIRVQVESGLLKKFPVKICVHHGSVLLLLLLVTLVHVVRENARESLMDEILYVHDLVLTSENLVLTSGTMENNLWERC